MRVSNLLHRLKGIIITKDDCSWVWNVDPDKRCEWVRSTSDCKLNSYIQYAEILFCSFDSSKSHLFIPGIILCVLWLLYLFLVLGTSADNFFCPSLSVIADVLRLSENIAGVTILAFGNGAPDVFTSLVSEEGIGELIMFVELIGAGVFVTAVIAGTIGIVAPVDIIAKTFIRDCCFYVSSIIWVSYISADDVIELWESLSLLLIYVLFILCVVIMQWIDNREVNRKDKILQIQDNDMLQTYLSPTTAQKHISKRVKAGAFSIKTKIDLAIATEISKVQFDSDESPSSSQVDLSQNGRPKGLFAEFFFDMNPIKAYDWKNANFLLRIILILRIPIMLVLQFIIPVVNKTAAKSGWSKLLNCIQPSVLPTVAVIILKVDDVEVGPLPLVVIVFVLGAVVSVVLITRTSRDQPPKYHNAFALLGFLGATLVVWVIAGEVMAVLESIGFASRISDAMLGLTLLAWGNSVGDLISNVAIARQGFARMGYSACFGGPLFNTLVGLGLHWTYTAFQHHDYRTHIINSDMMPGCLAFLLCSLTTSFLYLNITGFALRQSYGYVLISIYLVFMLINLLSEIKFIHPLGADHRPLTGIVQ
ncbi:mitochondrial sodium/calcium exchanger protein-like isoform X1 [Cotesia glomerata]|uniref:mitochondrial sodium/calcium exchanger protein-like isoform X1 n=2 Tax=Cotesia glomerata TaxID=32391 RepID=UPI001D02F06A|nr:mitochondrial sodium/calcium exchanger protein-like isoform X1 [Cotesia glomerata]